MSAGASIIKTWLRITKVIFNIAYILLFLYSLFLMLILSVRLMPQKYVDIKNSYLMCDEQPAQNLQKLIDEGKLVGLIDRYRFPDNEDNMVLKKICDNNQYRLNLAYLNNRSWFSYYLQVFIGTVVLILIFVIIKKFFNYLLVKIPEQNK